MKLTTTDLGMLREVMSGKEAGPPKYDPVQYLMEKARGDRLPNGLKPLKNLTTRHIAILNLHILGFKGLDIAEHFHIRGTLVSRIINDPLGKTYLESRLKLDDSRFTALYGKAVDAIRDGLSSDESIGNRLRAASIYLERKDKLDEKYGKKTDSAEDVIQRILDDPTIIQNLNLQVNNYGPAPLAAPAVIEQENEDERT